MKNLRIILTIVILATISSVFPIQINGQPDPPSGHGTTGDAAPGGGAPIGSGTLIIISMSIAYGAIKIYGHKKDELEE